MSNVLTLIGQTRDTLYIGTINSRSRGVLAARYDGSHVMSLSQRGLNVTERIKQDVFYSLKRSGTKGHH